MTESPASLSERALEDLRDVFARLPDDAADYRSLCAVHTKRRNRASDIRS
jgi:hypothetical protein